MLLLLVLLLMLLLLMVLAMVVVVRGGYLRDRGHHRGRIHSQTLADAMKGNALWFLDQFSLEESRPFASCMLIVVRCCHVKGVAHQWSGPKLFGYGAVVNEHTKQGRCHPSPIKVCDVITI
jgi:hypothetical protein